MNILDVMRKGEFPLNRVFISYRTIEHKLIAQEMYKILADNKFRIWFDQEEKSLPNFHYEGLDYFIAQGINETDVMIYLISEQKETVVKRGIKDTVDSFATALDREYGNSFPYAYQLLYLIIYKKNIIRLPFSGKRWQEWELETAEKLGLPIIKVRIVGVDESLQVSNNDEIQIRRAHLELDMQNLVLGNVNNAFKIKNNIRPGIVKLYSHFLLMAGVIIGFLFGLLLFLLVWLVISFI